MLDELVSCPSTCFLFSIVLTSNPRIFDVYLTPPSSSSFSSPFGGATVSSPWLISSLVSLLLAAISVNQRNADKNAESPARSSGQENSVSKLPLSRKLPSSPNDYVSVAVSVLRNAPSAPSTLSTCPQISKPR